MLYAYEKINIFTFMVKQNRIEKRIVAFIDILGFRELLNAKPLQELAKEYDYMVSATDAMEFN